MNIARVDRDVTASTYNTPMFRSARAVFLAKGTTAIMRITGISMAMGTRVKTRRSALAGVVSSLKNSLSMSAMGCSRPKGPQRLGPMRFWNRPIRRRSTQV